MKNKFHYLLDLQLFAEGEPKEKSEEEKKIEELTKRIDDLSTEVTTLKGANQNLTTELSNTKQELNNTKKELSDTRDAYKEVFGEGNKKVIVQTSTPEGDKSLLDLVAECQLK